MIIRFAIISVSIIVLGFLLGFYFQCNFVQKKGAANFSGVCFNMQTSILNSSLEQNKSSFLLQEDKIKNKHQLQNQKQKEQANNIKEIQNRTITVTEKEHEKQINTGDNYKVNQYKKTSTIAPIQNKKSTTSVDASAEPKYFYNQAYIENFQVDSLSDILNAKDSYVLLDPFDDENIRKNIAKIKRKNNLVGCYISVGTIENWRNDFNLLKNNIAKKEWDNWEGEYFVAKIDDNLLDVMKSRIDKMKNWGCDFVELDNMDWVQEDNIKKYNLKISEAEAKKYISELINYIHFKNMKAMAKNTTLGIANFDGLTTESYTNEKNWWNKAEMKNILKNGGIVAIVHYNEGDCENVKKFYNNIYGNNILFICEDKKIKRYRHFKANF